MECTVKIENDSVVVVSDVRSFPLRMSITKPYCNLFETTFAQCRDYVDEVVRWCGDYPANFDAFSKTIMHITSARRYQYGFVK